MRFRTRTQEVEAIQYTGDNAAEVMAKCPVASAHSDGKGNEWIEILDGFKRRLKVYAPALLLCDKRGDWWHSDPEWFENTYEPIPDLIRTVEDYEGLPAESILVVVDKGYSNLKKDELRYAHECHPTYAILGIVCSVVRLGGEQ